MNVSRAAAIAAVLGGLAWVVSGLLAWGQDVNVSIYTVGLVCFLLGCLVTQNVFLYAQAGKTKEPTWLHGLELRVRKAGEADFTKDTKKWGLEVFRDENTGSLIYISETGSISVVPAK